MYPIIETLYEATGSKAGTVFMMMIIYFVIAFLLTRTMRGLEKKLKAGVGKTPTPKKDVELKRPETTNAGGAVR